MPNWCANSLKITPKTIKAKKLLAKIENHLENINSNQECELFNMIKPMPESLINTEKACGGTPEEQEAREAKQKANLEKYGYPTWYEFANAEWGTKWDAEYDTHEKRGDSLVIWFNTAWSPPMGIYMKLIKLGFKVEATYCEGGIGYAGVFKDGVDDEHEVSFYEEDEDEIENMIHFFQQRGVDHYPAHTGG